MTRLALAMAVIVGTACWRSSPPPPAPVVNSAPVVRAHPDARPVHDVDALLDRMADFADQLCSCSDSACIQQVSDEMVKWSQQQQAQHEAPRFDDEDTKRAAMISERMSKCMMKVMAGSGGP